MFCIRQTFCTFVCRRVANRKKERKESRAVAEELTLLYCSKYRQSVNGDYDKQQRAQMLLVNVLSSGRKRVVNERRGNWSQIKQINKPITSESYDLFLLIECSRTFF